MVRVYEKEIVNSRYQYINDKIYQHTNCMEWNYKAFYTVYIPERAKNACDILINNLSYIFITPVNLYDKNGGSCHHSTYEWILTDKSQNANVNWE